MLETLLWWDERIFRFVNGDWIHPTLDRVMPFVTDARHYSIPFVVAAIMVMMVGRLAGARFVVVAIIGVVVADMIGNYIFKHSFARSRPCLVLEGVRLLMGCTDSASFPSNHAVNAGVLATLVRVYLPRVWVPALALALLVAYSRVYVGVHYPLDVLVGGGLGLVVALLLSRLMNFLWPAPSGQEGQRRIVSRKIRDD